MSDIIKDLKSKFVAIETEAYDLLKLKIKEICDKHQINFDSGMGSYSFDFTIDDNNISYFYDDYKDKNISQLIYDYEHDLKVVIADEDIKYYNDKLKEFKKIETFHEDVIDLVSTYSDIKKIFPVYLDIIPSYSTQI